MVLRPSVVVLFIFVYILTVNCHVEEVNKPYDLFSDDDPHRHLEFTRYEERVKIIQKILAEECSDQHLQRLKRAIISGHGETQLFVEKILFEKMVRKLAECRTMLAQKTSLSPNTTTTPTTTTTTPTITTTPTTTTTTPTITTTPTTTSRPQPPECHTAINLTESWRLDHNGSRIRPISGNVNCDSRTMKTNNKPWFRFTGAAGDKMLDRCPPPNSCGSKIGIWTDASMPTNVGVSVSLVFYGSWTRSGCKEFTGTLLALRCSTSTSHDLIYKFVSGNSYFGCDNSFCGMRSN